MWINKSEFWALKKQAEHAFSVDAQMRQERIRQSKAAESILTENRLLTKKIGELNIQLEQARALYEDLKTKYEELLAQMR